MIREADKQSPADRATFRLLWDDPRADLVMGRPEVHPLIVEDDTGRAVAATAVFFPHQARGVDKPEPNEVAYLGTVGLLDRDNPDPAAMHAAIVAACQATADAGYQLGYAEIPIVDPYLKAVADWVWETFSGTGVMRREVVGVDGETQEPHVVRLVVIPAEAAREFAKAPVPALGPRVQGIAKRVARR